MRKECISLGSGGSLGTYPQITVMQSLWKKCAPEMPPMSPVVADYPDPVPTPISRTCINLSDIKFNIQNEWMDWTCLPRWSGDHASLAILFLLGLLFDICELMQQNMSLHLAINSIDWQNECKAYNGPCVHLLAITSYQHQFGSIYLYAPAPCQYYAPSRTRAVPDPSLEKGGGRG